MAIFGSRRKLWRSSNVFRIFRQSLKVVGKSSKIQVLWRRKFSRFLTKKSWQVYSVCCYKAVALPREIFMELFGLLTSKVRSPSHLFRSPGSNLPWSIQQVGEDRGGGVWCNCINLGERSGRRDFPRDTNNIHRLTSIKFLNQISI